MARRTAPGRNPELPAASEWSNSMDAGQMYAQQQRLGKGVKPIDPLIRTDIITVKNNTGAGRTFGQVVQVGLRILTKLKREKLWFLGETPDVTTYRIPAILLRAIPSGKTGEAQVSGWAIARVNIATAGDYMAYVANGNHVLQSGPYGPIRIISNEGSSGEQTATVELPVRFGTSFVGQVAGGGISAATTVSTMRRPGSGYVTTYRRIYNGSVNELVGIGGLVLVYNSTVQTAAANDFVQCKGDYFGDVWWDTADC